MACKRFEESQAISGRAERLSEEIVSRKLVERAKGVLMQSGLSEEDAYRALQLHARNNRITMRDAAAAILGEGSARGQS